MDADHYPELKNQTSAAIAHITARAVKGELNMVEMGDLLLEYLNKHTDEDLRTVAGLIAYLGVWSACRGSEDRVKEERLKPLKDFFHEHQVLFETRRYLYYQARL